MKSQQFATRRSVRMAALTTVVATAGFALVAAPATAKPKPKPLPSGYTVVAYGLDNPRGIGIHDHNRLWVAEAGEGGTECTDIDLGEQTCFGFTGAITLIKDADKKKKTPTVQRVITGLLSASKVNGTEAVGIDGIDLRHRNELYGVMAESSEGFAADLANFDLLTPPSAELTAAVNDYAGRLIRVRKLEPPKKSPKAQLTVVDNIGSYNWAWSNTNKSEAWAPTSQFPDANPYDVVTSGDRQWVVDAGTNTVVEVRKKKGVTTHRVLAYLPNTDTSDAVPTCIARKGEYLYIGTWNAYGAAGASGSRVYRVSTKADPANFLTNATVWAEGFNPITACGFGPKGFYVVEFMTASSSFANGAIVRVTVNGDGTAGAKDTFGTSLVQPGGLAIHGNLLYVSNYSTYPGASNAVDAGGQIVRFKL